MTLIKLDNDTVIEADQSPKQTLSALKAELDQLQTLLAEEKAKTLSEVRQAGADEAEMRWKLRKDDYAAAIAEHKARIAEVKAALGV